MSEDAKFVRDIRPVDRDYNRANDTQSDGNEILVSLQTIDSAVIKYLSERIRPVVTQNGTQVPVPIVYGHPERWKSAQRDGVLRDSLGKIQLPMLMIQRTSLSKSQPSSPVNKYYERSFQTGWNRRNPYDRFAVTNNITPSKEYYTISGTPDYYTLAYKCIIWTEYVEQMNKVIENISYESDEFWGERDGYKFRTYVKRFDTTDQLPSSGDRMVRTSFEMTVHGYLLPEAQLDQNSNRKLITSRKYGVKKVVTFTEVEDQ